MFFVMSLITCASMNISIFIGFVLTYIVTSRTSLSTIDISLSVFSDFVQLSTGKY